jgi:hypothetical protein
MIGRFFRPKRMQRNMQHLYSPSYDWKMIIFMIPYHHPRIRLLHGINIDPSIILIPMIILRRMIRINERKVFIRIRQGHERYLRGMLEDEPNTANTSNSATNSTTNKKGGMKKSTAITATSKSATTSSAKGREIVTNKKKRSLSSIPTAKTK